MKIGRYGSNTVRLPIHAPLNPKAIKTSGPRQQADARMAASPPAKSAPRPFCGSDFCGSDFCGSDFCGSDFCGSDFCGSDIRLSFQIWFG
ncbi:pentapeptide repeat-containing protein [Klebsiella pneumoniae]